MSATLTETPTLVETRTQAGAPLEIGEHEHIVNNDERVFTNADLEIGDAVAQGDWYMVRVPELPKSAKPRTSNALGIAGVDVDSRPHIVVGGELFDADQSELADLIRQHNGAKVEARFIGPVIRGGTLEHTEANPTIKHGTHKYPDDAILITVKQREMERAVID